MRQNTWNDGKYVDTWSAVHLLSGYVLASTLFLLGLDYFWNIFATMLLQILWEVFEAVVKIIEPVVNVIMDILIGMVGALGSVYIYYVLSEPFDPTRYSFLFFMNLLLAFWGFANFLRTES